MTRDDLLLFPFLSIYRNPLFNLIYKTELLVNYSFHQITKLPSLNCVIKNWSPFISSTEDINTTRRFTNEGLTWLASIFTLYCYRWHVFIFLAPSILTFSSPLSPSLAHCALCTPSSHSHLLNKGWRVPTPSQWWWG